MSLVHRFGRRAAICIDCIPLVRAHHCLHHYFVPGILRQTKNCDHCCSIPSQIGGWLLIWGATSLNHLYIARAITGVGIGAGVPIASIYMRWVELSNTHTNILPLTIEKKT